jgi:hypothetical protein
MINQKKEVAKNEREKGKSQTGLKKKKKRVRAKMENQAK